MPAIKFWDVYEKPDGWHFKMPFADPDGPYPTEDIAKSAMAYYGEAILGWLKHEADARGDNARQL